MSDRLDYHMDNTDAASFEFMKGFVREAINNSEDRDKLLADPEMDIDQNINHWTSSDLSVLKPLNGILFNVKIDALRHERNGNEMSKDDWKTVCEAVNLIKQKRMTK